MSEAKQIDLPKPRALGHLRTVLTGPSAPKPTEDMIDLHHLWGIIRRRANVILGATILGTVLATIFIFQLTPRYTAEATVMLETRKNQMVDFTSLMAGLTGDQSVVRSEMEILKSRALADKVAEKLEMDTWPEFNPALRKPGFFEALLSPFGWVTNAIRSLTTSSSAAALNNEARARDRKAAEVSLLMNRMEITNDGRSYLIKIHAQSTNRNAAALIANTYVDFYLLDQIEAKFDAVKRATGWLNDQLDTLRGKVRDSEHAVEVYKDQNNLTQTTKGTTLSEQQLSELNSQLILATADRAQKESSLAQARSGGESTAVNNSPLVEKLRTDEADLRHKKAELSNRYQPSHPTMVNLQSQIDDIKRKIDEESSKTVRSLQGDVAAARAKENSLKEQLASLQKSNNQEGKLDVQLRELQREADANKLLYENFLTKFKQTSSEEDIQQADARLVSSALPPRIPSFPKKTVLIGFSFLVSLLVGAAAAFIMERLDNGFHNSDQVEKLLGVSTLGLVPGIVRQELPQDVVVKRPTSQYSEAIRSIRTALRYSDVDNPPKVVLITSSLSGEGKTVFATSLARSVARSGGKALLVDCDLRRPSVARLLNVEGEPGVLDIFAENSNPDALIRRDEESGMHYIPSKGGTANPQDLLSSQQMRAFLERMRGRYDLIVLDAPPVLAVSDPIILSHFVDTTIYLVRWETTPRPIVTGAVKMLRANGGEIAGVVLSRVNSRKHATYGYGDSGYYYGRYSAYYGESQSSPPT
ncbi:MAG TPA: polysaccharide biosynthesis tyrosine autokinase [Alphaproteobacteria bacterium]|jgi:capsular exopolysaccharide synthesis family protein|nr:polysaccharide biosynthesis tyrosine autokinase [Alphaproteobacteria bacterium]